MHENAPKYGFSNYKISKFSGEGHPQTHPRGGGNPTPSASRHRRLGALHCLLVPLQLAVAGDAAESMKW